MLRILHDTKYDFIKYWKTAAIGTIAFIVLGMVLLGVHAARHNGAGAELQRRVHRRHRRAAAVRAAARRRRRSRRGRRRRASPAPRSRRSATPNDYLVKVQRRRQARPRPRTPTASARRSRASLDAAAARATSRRCVRAESVGPRVGSELQDEGDHRDPHLVHRHADLSRDPLRVALRRRRRRSRRRTTSSRRWRSSR